VSPLCRTWQTRRSQFAGSDSLDLSYKSVTHFASFINVADLMMMFRSVADVVQVTEGWAGWVGPETADDNEGGGEDRTAPEAGDEDADGFDHDDQAEREAA
jgi:hypothetical protein